MAVAYGLMMFESSDILEQVRGQATVAATLLCTTEPVYLVGGAVRDLLLGRPVHDFDLAVASPLEDLAWAVSNHLNVKAILLGHGNQRIYRLVHQGKIVDLCPLDDSIERDLIRRDLTINALAIDLNTTSPGRTIIDPVGGLTDLKLRTARFVSEAAVLADPLRMLRLFRFGAVLNFKLADESLAMVKIHAPMITSVAGERIREELWQLLNTPDSRFMVQAMQLCGLLAALMPEIKPLAGCFQGGYHHLDVWDHSWEAFCFVENYLADPDQVLPGFAQELNEYLSDPNRPAVLKLAALLHDVGKPGTKNIDRDQIKFHGHENLGVDIAMAICGRIRTSLAESETIEQLIRWHLQPFHLLKAHQAGQLSQKAVYRFGRQVDGHIWGLALLALADAAAMRGPRHNDRGGIEAFKHFLMTELLGEIIRQRDKVKKEPRLVSGQDLLTTFNLKPSPLIGQVLADIIEAQALGQVTNREEALTLAASLIPDH